jgi:hypothetical protein
MGSPVVGAEEPVSVPLGAVVEVEFRSPACGWAVEPRGVLVPFEEGEAVFAAAVDWEGAVVVVDPPEGGAAVVPVGEDVVFGWLVVVVVAAAVVVVETGVAG